METSIPTSHSHFERLSLFDRLPDELVLLIAKHLAVSNVGSLVLFQRTCKRFRALIKHNHTKLLAAIVDEIPQVPKTMSTWEHLGLYEAMKRAGLISENTICFDSRGGIDGDPEDDDNNDDLNHNDEYPLRRRVRQRLQEDRPTREHDGEDHHPRSNPSPLYGHDDDDDDHHHHHPTGRRLWNGRRVIPVRGYRRRIHAVQKLMRQFPKAKVIIDSHCGFFVSAGDPISHQQGMLVYKEIIQTFFQELVAAQSKAKEKEKNIGGNLGATASHERNSDGDRESTLEEDETRIDANIQQVCDDCYDFHDLLDHYRNDPWNNDMDLDQARIDFQKNVERIVVHAWGCSIMIAQFALQFTHCFGDLAWGDKCWVEVYLKIGDVELPTRPRFYADEAGFFSLVQATTL